MDHKEIQPGTLLISEKPFVYALSSKCRTEHCDFCFSKGDLRKCSNCHYVYYCNRNCQKEGWVLHKFECKHLKQVAPRIVPDAARLLIRLVKKLDNGGSTVKSYYAPNKCRRFKDLMSHYPNIKDDARKMEHFFSLCNVLSEFFGDNYAINTSELLGIYGRMCVNSFNIADDEIRSLGTGIYLGASIVDHSCQPNAVAIFHGTTINIRATEFLPTLFWSKIFVSYIDTLQLPHLRQEELQSTYYFLCKCPRCIDPMEEKAMCAAACPNKNCTALLDLAAVTENCSVCDAIITHNVIQSYKEVTEMTEMHLQNMKLAYLDVCKVCLRKHQDVLHPLNIQHVKILDLAVESSIDFAQWDDAVEFGTKLIPGYRRYLGDVHPLLGLLYLKLAKILSYKEKIAEARGFLESACKILKITHGDNSPLFKREVVPLIKDVSSF